MQGISYESESVSNVSIFLAFVYILLVLIQQSWIYTHNLVIRDASFANFVFLMAYFGGLNFLLEKTVNDLQRANILETI